MGGYVRQYPAVGKGSFAEVFEARVSPEWFPQCRAVGGEGVDTDAPSLAFETSTPEALLVESFGARTAVAVKVMQLELLFSDEIRREVQTMRQVKHENILTMLACFVA